MAVKTHSTQKSSGKNFNILGVINPSIVSTIEMLIIGGGSDGDGTNGGGSANCGAARFG